MVYKTGITPAFPGCGEDYKKLDCSIDEKIERAESISIESPETDPYTYGNLIYDKDNMAEYWGKDITYNKWSQHNCKSIYNKRNITP